MNPAEQPRDIAGRFRVLHDSDTDMGAVLLRRRWSLALERDVYEMTMDGNLMMSDAVVASEQALAEQALKRLPDKNLRVLIGGLGFGFTARAALADDRVRELTVVELLAPVVEWHRTGLLPWSKEFINDPRLTIVQGDFFALVAGAAESRFDAVLIDIDDAPHFLWHDRHAAFYDAAGLTSLRMHIVPGGVLALWCAAHPGEAFLSAVEEVFAATELIEVPFENPSLRQPEINYIVLATMRSEDCDG